jgi:peptide deformylase
MSSANAGLAFNIIGITLNRNKKDEWSLIMINPEITYYSDDKAVTLSNCGSLTLNEPIELERSIEIRVSYYQEDGNYMKNVKFIRETGAFTIQHEVDHNLGILITDK